MSRWRDYLRGFCSAFDGAAISLFPARLDEYPHKNEAEAIQADWKAVGDTMKTVISQLERTIESVGMSDYSVTKARAEFAHDRYVIAGDDSGHKYVIPMSKRIEWSHWLGSRAWEAGEAPSWAMRVEGTLTFREPVIVYDA